MKALRLISNGVHNGMGTVKILAHRKLSMLCQKLSSHNGSAVACVIVSMLTIVKDYQRKMFPYAKISQTLVQL